MEWVGIKENEKTTLKTMSSVIDRKFLAIRNEILRYFVNNFLI